MPVGQLNATLRTETGKSVNRKLRQSGKIPAVCYGPGADPIQLAVDPTDAETGIIPQP
jgi:large subunit ribosomal protein L25